MIPTAWYPWDVVIDEKNNKLVVANVKGIGSQGPKVIGGPRMTVQSAKPTKKPGMWAFSHTGTVSIINIPTDARLTEYSKTVLKNNAMVNLEEKNRVATNTDVKPVPIPKNVGEPSVFKHVFFIIKENKTYDQMLGDMGNGDTDLLQFGPKYTPNHHKLAEEYMLFDNYYVAGTASFDGHQWMTQGLCVDYLEKAFGDLVRSYPFSGFDPLAYSQTGFIWEHAVQAGKSVRVYGEYADLYSDTYGHMGPWVSKFFITAAATTGVAVGACSITIIKS